MGRSPRGGGAAGDALPLPFDAAALLSIGRLGRSFQLEGGMRFHPHGPAEAHAMTVLAEVGIEGFGLSGIRAFRPQGRHLILFLTRVTGVDRARSLVDREVFADPAALPPTAGGTPYIAKLLGLPVQLDGAPLGEVSGVVDAGGQPLLRLATGRGEFLLPLAAPYVRLYEDRVEVEDPPAGLLGPA